MFFVLFSTELTETVFNTEFRRILEQKQKISYYCQQLNVKRTKRFAGANFIILSRSIWKRKKKITASALADLLNDPQNENERRLSNNFLVMSFRPFRARAHTLEPYYEILILMEILINFQFFFFSKLLTRSNLYRYWLSKLFERENPKYDVWFLTYEKKKKPTKIFFLL